MEIVNAMLQSIGLGNHLNVVLSKVIHFDGVLLEVLVLGVWRCLDVVALVPVYELTLVIDYPFYLNSHALELLLGEVIHKLMTDLNCVYAALTKDAL